MSRGIITILALVALVFPTMAGALEAPKKYRTEYSISVLGLRIAKSNFISTLSASDFTIEGEISSSGIARLFDRTKARTLVSGKLGGESSLPQSYALNYTSGGKAKKTLLAFSGGSVVSTQNTPPPGARRPSWLPVSEADLKAVTDPLSAAIIRAANLREVCKRTLRVYDGEIRADLKLSYAGIKPFSTRGFKGDAVRCRARFVPVSGYHQDRKAIDYLANHSRIEVAFGQIGRTGVYAPVTASVKTKIGTVRLYARRFAQAQ